MAHIKKGALAFLAASVLALAGCASGNESSQTTQDNAENTVENTANNDTDEVTTISFASYTLAADGQVGEGTKKLIADFEAENPDVKIEGRAIPNSDIFTKTRTDAAAGDAPDIVQMGYSKARQAMDELPLQAIDEVAGSEWSEATDPLPEGMLGTTEEDGHFYGVPFTVSTPIMFINDQLFEEAGLDPKNPPKTMDEVKEDAQKIVDNGHQGAYFDIVSTSKTDYLTQSLMNSAGGGIVSDDDEDITIDSPESVEGIQVISDLVNNGLMPKVKTEDALASFTQGDLGMFVATTAYGKNLQEAAQQAGWEMTTAGFPAIKDSLPVKPTHSGAALMMLSTDEKKQEAAWKFLKFVSSEEGQTTITKDIGYIPLRQDVIDDPQYLKTYFEEEPILLPAVEQMQDIQAYQFFPGKESNQDVVTLNDEALEPIVVRGEDPKTALTEVADKLRAKL